MDPLIKSQLLWYWTNGDDPDPISLASCNSVACDRAGHAAAGKNRVVELKHLDPSSKAISNSPRELLDARTPGGELEKSIFQTASGCAVKIS